MEQQKLIRVALHIQGVDVNEVLGLLGAKVLSKCVGLEIVESQDNRIISVFTPEVKPELEPEKRVFEKNDRIAYITDPATGLETYGYVLHMQGDMVAVRLDTHDEARLVEADRIRKLK